MDLTYEEFISNILETRGRFACGDEYHERHHIVPKCMDGTNDKENLIDLFAREHFEAHRLLALENPENRGLQYAWWNMCNIKGSNKNHRYETSPEEYEEARIVISRLPSPMLGKHLSEDQKKTLSAHLKKRWENDEFRNNMIEFLKTQTGCKNPNYGNHKLAGANNPNYGKPMSEEHKRKISAARKGKYAKENHPRAMIVIQYTENLTLVKVW